MTTKTSDNENKKYKKEGQQNPIVACKGKIYVSNMVILNAIEMIGGGAEGAGIRHRA